MKHLLLAASFAATLATAPAWADNTQHLVDSSTLALQDMMGGAQGSQAQAFLQEAWAVVVCPDVFRAGILIGGEGGKCVLSARMQDGNWSNPAIYSMGGGSFGLQIGLQNSELMMIIMTQQGLNALLRSHFKIGADAGLTVATFGTGINGSMSTALKADIVSFAKSQGLYVGISLAGTVFSNDAGREQAYYGQALNTRQIVVDGMGTNPGANPLRDVLKQYGG